MPFRVSMRDIILQPPPPRLFDGLHNYSLVTDLVGSARISEGVEAEMKNILLAWGSPAVVVLTWPGLYPPTRTILPKSLRQNAVRCNCVCGPTSVRHEGYRGPFRVRIFPCSAPARGRRLETRGTRHETRDTINHETLRIWYI